MVWKALQFQINSYWRRIQHMLNLTIYRQRHNDINPSGVKSPPTSDSQKWPRRLVAFDFDHTIVSQNTDTVLREKLPKEAVSKDMYYMVEKYGGWIPYMSELFRVLHEHGFTPEMICSTLEAIPEVPGMIECLKTLRLYNCDLVIISDANSVFIEVWLKTHGLFDCIERIYTNPSIFKSNGLLTIKPYHNQTDCRISPPNFCKGKILEQFLMERDLRVDVTYEQVIYVGDGNNDICPVLRLKRNDLACARNGFPMAKNLEKYKSRLKLRAKLIHWNNGYDLFMQILETLKHNTEKNIK